MVLVLETGSGVRNANSYVTRAFVTAYLTARGRETEGSWSTTGSVDQDEACVAASDYLDKRWGSRLKGVRKFSYSGVKAQSKVTLAGQPSDSETITVGERTYTFVAALTDFSQDQVLIGSSVAETAQNLIDAIAATSAVAGTTISDSQVVNSSVVAALADGTTDQVVFTAIEFGESGNDIPLSDTSANITLDTATFVNGSDQGAQPMEFPRLGAVSSDGYEITGVPLKVKQAAAEYAVRANQAALIADPTVDATGQVVQRKREKVGPIEEETEYVEGGTLDRLLKPYPAADSLMQDFVTASGQTIRA